MELRKLRGTGSAATLMCWGGGATLAHVVLSLGLFSSGYFDKLFASILQTCQIRATRDPLNPVDAPEKTSQ